MPNVPRRHQYFSIWIRPVAPENAHFALRGAIFYLRRLVEDGMSEADFEGMREYIMSYSKLWAQTSIGGSATSSTRASIRRALTSKKSKPDCAP